MAAMLTTRRALSSTLFHKFSSSVRSLAPTFGVRSFNTNEQMRHPDPDPDPSIDHRRSDGSISPLKRMDATPSFFADVFDPFIPSIPFSSLGRMMNMIHQMMESPFWAGGTGARRGWDAKEVKDALYLRIDMPGLGKEDVKVSAEQNTLIIKGEGEKESDNEVSERRFSTRIELPPKLYKMDETRAEMNNGVLKVSVPKVKEEERKDVFQVKIE